LQTVSDKRLSLALGPITIAGNSDHDQLETPITIGWNG